MRRLKCVWSGRDFCLVMSLGIALLFTFGRASLAAQNESVQRYKMLSTLEYGSKSQFRSKVETLFTVRKQSLVDGKVRYVVSANKLDVVGEGLNSGQPSSFRELSFVVDGKTQQLSGIDKDLAFLEKVSNQCVKTLRKVTKKNVGQTWKQSFDVSSLGNSLPRELRFTLTAIPLETETFGELVAVRALSEPFFVKTAKGESAVGSIQCRINCAYVFDSEFEDIYLSVSVFKAATNVNGINEKLQHVVTTRKTDATGRLADFNELSKDKDFEKLVSKLGLTSSLKVVKGAPLPQWARAEGVRAAQVANICAATSCEGALNPVATVFMPAACTVGLQSLSESVTTSALLTAAGGRRYRGETGGEGGGWDWFGWNWQTAAWGTGIGFGTAGLAGAWDETETKYRSPSTP